MLVVQYFRLLDYSPFEVAMLFLFYESFGFVTNLVGGWLGARIGLDLTMHIGIAMQAVALGLLTVPDTRLSVPRGSKGASGGRRASFWQRPCCHLSCPSSRRARRGQPLFEALANLVVYKALGLDPASHLGAALHFFAKDTAKIFALLVIVIYLMGLLRALLSPERVREFVRGRPDWQARGFAVTLGAVTPFCSCSSVPLFIGFVEAGIPLGVTFSFLIASPMINEVAAVILVGILGWKLAALYVGAGLLVAWVGGIVMQSFRPERWVEEYVWRIQMGQADLAEPDRSFAGRHRYAVTEVTEIVGRIWRWVLLGIGVGALFHGFVPEQWVSANLGGDAWYTVPVAVLMGIPLYSNATGVIPVAEAMLTKGVAVGTTLALMMSVAALSLPEMLILRKVIKWQALALFAGVLAVAFTLVGWGFNVVA
jgi:uncharacterized membrane protein YraQ (UPF0718 family)